MALMGIIRPRASKSIRHLHAVTMTPLTLRGQANDAGAVIQPLRAACVGLLVTG